jgi:hypothetical protein
MHATFGIIFSSESYYVLGELQLFYTNLSVYRACPFFLIDETSIINDRINPFLSTAIGAPQSPCTWNETRTGEA